MHGANAMTYRILALLSVLCMGLTLPGATTDDFTVHCTVDISGVAADEPLYEVGPSRLAFRMAGRTEELERYDRFLDNYLNFPLPDGSCPVIEATMYGLRVGIPLGFLKRRDGVHDVRLFCAKGHLTIEVEGHFDDDMFRLPTVEADLSAPKTLSRRVKSADVAVLAGAPGGVNFSRPVDKPIQYWTPPDHNSWVGDVSPSVHQGRLHVFYLFDRRHHTSKQRAGGHFYAHLSSDDLVHWTEHPFAIPLEEWWTSEGTGTPFVKDGRLCLSYGLHTSRITKSPLYPIGGTYAESEDGIHFVKSGKIITDAQNPSIYNLPGGGFELVTSYGGKKGIFRSDDLVIAFDLPSYSVLLTEAVRKAREHGAPVVTITDSPAAPVCSSATLSFFVSDNSPTFGSSLIGPLFLIHILTSRLSLDLGDAAMKALAEQSQCLRDERLYYPVYALRY